SGEPPIGAQGVGAALRFQRSIASLTPDSAVANEVFERWSWLVLPSRAIEDSSAAEATANAATVISSTVGNAKPLCSRLRRDSILLGPSGRLGAPVSRVVQTAK